MINEELKEKLKGKSLDELIDLAIAGLQAMKFEGEDMELEDTKN